MNNQKHIFTIVINNILNFLTKPLRSSKSRSSKLLIRARSLSKSPRSSLSLRSSKSTRSPPQQPRTRQSTKSSPRRPYKNEDIKDKRLLGGKKLNKKVKNINGEFPLTATKAYKFAQGLFYNDKQILEIESNEKKRYEEWLDNYNNKKIKPLKVGDIVKLDNGIEARLVGRLINPLPIKAYMTEGTWFFINIHSKTKELIEYHESELTLHKEFDYNDKNSILEFQIEFKNEVMAKHRKIIKENNNILNKKNGGEIKPPPRPSLTTPATPGVEPPPRKNPQAPPRPSLTTPATPDVEPPPRKNPQAPPRPSLTTPATPGVEPPPRKNPQAPPRPSLTTPATPDVEPPPRKNPQAPPRPSLTTPATPGVEPPPRKNPQAPPRPSLTTPATPDVEPPPRKNPQAPPRPSLTTPATPGVEPPPRSPQAPSRPSLTTPATPGVKAAPKSPEPPPRKSVVGPGNSHRKKFIILKSTLRTWDDFDDKGKRRMNISKVVTNIKTALTRAKEPEKKTKKHRMYAPNEFEEAQQLKQQKARRAGLSVVPAADLSATSCKDFPGDNKGTPQSKGKIHLGLKWKIVYIGEQIFNKNYADSFANTVFPSNDRITSEKFNCLINKGLMLNSENIKRNDIIYFNTGEPGYGWQPKERIEGFNNTRMEIGLPRDVKDTNWIFVWIDDNNKELIDTQQ